MFVNYTTIGGFALMIAKALDAYQVDSEDVLASCGIDRQLLSDPDNRVSVDKIGRLLELAVRETQEYHRETAALRPSGASQPQRSCDSEMLAPI